MTAPKTAKQERVAVVAYLRQERDALLSEAYDRRGKLIDDELKSGADWFDVISEMIEDGVHIGGKPRRFGWEKL